MKKTTFLVVITAAHLLLGACGGGDRWRHAEKSLHDFAIDDRECQMLAEAAAKDASLVPQPILTVYYQSHSNCLRSKGWESESAVNYTPPAVTLTQTEDAILFEKEGLSLKLPGTYKVLQQQSAAYLLEKDATYAYFLFQLDHPTPFLRSSPPLNPQAVRFDEYRSENLSAKFYYQEANGKLIFACTAHLYRDDKNRVVVSLSREFFDMPADFNSLPQENFAELTRCRQQWQEQLDNLSEQL